MPIRRCFKHVKLNNNASLVIIEEKICLGDTCQSSLNNFEQQNVRRILMLPNLHFPICFRPAILLLMDFSYSPYSPPSFYSGFLLIELPLGSLASCIIYIPHLSDMSADFFSVYPGGLDGTALPNESSDRC